MAGGAVREFRVPVRRGRGWVQAWLHRAPGVGRAPTVVLLQGIALRAADAPVPEVVAALNACRLHAVTFDYEGFGASATGEPRLRQVFSPSRQRVEARAMLDALSAAHALATLADTGDAVDRARLALWGYSYGASHALMVGAAAAPGLRAIVARAPFAVGLPYVARVAWRDPWRLTRLFGRGLADQALALVPGVPPRYVPIFGRRGEVCVFVEEDAEYGALVGAGFPNAIAPRFALRVAAHVRPFWRARALRVPLLVTCGEGDDVAGAWRTRRLAARARRGGVPVDELPLAGHDHFSASRFSASRFSASRPSAPAPGAALAREEAEWLRARLCAPETAAASPPGTSSDLT